MFWAVEEAVSSPVVAGVSAIFHASAPVDLKFTRRISLRSEKSGVPVYLMTVGGQPFPTSAATHWNVSHAPSEGRTDSRMWVRGGNPCWKIDQIKNKKGSCRNLSLKYDPLTSSLQEVRSKVESSWAHYPVGEAGRSDRKSAVVVPFARPSRQSAPVARAL